jgi:hypothetical protein
MKFLKYLFLILASVIIVFCAIVAMQPNDFKVSRSSMIIASPDKIFEQINDFHQWNNWSPWAKIDPNSKTSFDGANQGEGSIMIWDSENQEVGKGRMKIVDSTPNTFIKIQLNFEEPMAGESFVEFNIDKKNDTQNELTWTMYGTNNFIGKAMGLIFDCDTMIGKKFEEGLNNIKTLVEK